MSDAPLYEIKDLEYRYGDKFILNIPHLTIEKGDSISLSGPNGSGKSTLLKILAFIEFPCRGTVSFNGIKATNVNAPLTQNVTLLLQDPYLLKKTVFENVAYGLRVRRSKDNLTARVCESLRLVGLPPERFAQRRWYELSGGESQRVALASRIIINPEVLILDEPTANVDQQSAFLIKEVISSIRKKFGTSLIIVSHDHIWRNQVTDKNIDIYEGRIREYSTHNIVHGPWTPAAEGLWEKTLPDNQKIYAVNPPDKNATAILSPSNIIVSTEQPVSISAQNILKGIITSMNLEKEPGKVRIDAAVSGMPLACSVTQHAAGDLQLIPGKDVWVVFKASSLQWH